MRARSLRRLPGVPIPTSGRPPEPLPLLVAVQAGLEPAAVQRLCEQVRAELVTSGTRSVVCVVHCGADLAVVDLLARLVVTSRRTGARMQVQTGAADLAELLRLTGLDVVVPAD